MVAAVPNAASSRACASARTLRDAAIGRPAIRRSAEGGISGSGCSVLAGSDWNPVGTSAKGRVQVSGMGDGTAGRGIGVAAFGGSAIRRSAVGGNSDRGCSLRAGAEWNSGGISSNWRAWVSAKRRCPAGRGIGVAACNGPATRRSAVGGNSGLWCPVLVGANRNPVGTNSRARALPRIGYPAERCDGRKGKRPKVATGGRGESAIVGSASVIDPTMDGLAGNDRTGSCHSARVSSVEGPLPDSLGLRRRSISRPDMGGGGSPA